MKARPIENVLKHCKKIDKQYGDIVSTSDQSMWNKNLGWIQAIKYVIANYNCTPKQVQNECKGVYMPAKR